MNGSERSSSLIRKIMREASRVRKSLESGKPVSIGSQFEKYMRIEQAEDGTTVLVFDYDRWQRGLDPKGNIGTIFLKLKFYTEIKKFTYRKKQRLLKTNLLY